MRERPRAVDGGQRDRRLLGRAGMPLAGPAPLHVDSGVVGHGGLVVPLTEDFVGQGPSSNMLPADPLMDLSEDRLCFVRLEASQ